MSRGFFIDPADAFHMDSEAYRISQDGLDSLSNPNGDYGDDNMRLKIEDCPECKAPRFWAKSKKTGSNMMFDEVPGSGKIFKWAIFEDGTDLKAEYVRSDDQELYSSHFDTCEAKDGSPHRAAAETRREAPQTARRAPEPARREPEPVERGPKLLTCGHTTKDHAEYHHGECPIVVVRKGTVEVTVTVDGHIYSGTCTLVTKTANISDADDSGL